MPDLEQPSYEELAARNAELTARVAELLAVAAEQTALIESLRAEVTALRRQAGRDSSNSSHGLVGYSAVSTNTPNPFAMQSTENGIPK